MAKLEPGQLGDANGKIGRVVVSKWKKLMVLRAAPKSSTKPPKLLQLQQRAMFGLVTAFISGVGSIINLGFQKVAKNNSPFNTATKYHLANAVTGTYPDYVMDYPEVVIGEGKAKVSIDGLPVINVSAAVDGKVTLSWEALPANRSVSLPTDLLYVVFYNATEDFFMIDPAAAQRSELTASVRVPQEATTDKIYGWALFVSADNTLASRSKYLGQINLAGI